MKNMGVFTLSPAQRDLMLDIADEVGATTNAELVTILTVMSQFGQVTTTIVTKRSKEKFIRDMAKHYHILRKEAKQ